MNGTHSWSLAPALALLLACAPATSTADPGPGREAATSASRPHFDRGELLYRQGKFQAAIEAYSAALKLDMHPSHLFNIAQCHRQLGNLEQAIFYYRLHISDWEKRFRDVTSPWREEAEAHIAALTKRITRRPRAGKGAGAAAAPEGGRSLQKAAGGHRSSTCAIPRPGPPAWLRTTSWVLVGVGGAALATGLALGVTAEVDRGRYRDLAGGQSSYGELMDLKQQVHTYEQAQMWTLIVGAALAAAGGTYLLTEYFLLRDRPGERKARQVVFAPVGGPDSLGFSALARF